ncbi:MAG: sugar ABC transporter permease, partial [Oscillospiraceae bacterium]|jgi:putative multiple sugar transport system permease protein|nr:sugar ABC transporter permease [Oscillospiraceae bacterium]
LLVLLIIVVLGNFITEGVLLKPMNVSNLINQNAYIVVLAVGMLICILTGGNIDLAVGSVVALVGACAGTFIVTWGMNTYLSVALCLLVGIAIGAWQGFWIAYVRIPAFIVTLSGQLVFRGLTLLILNGMTISPFPEDFMNLTTGFIGGADSRATIARVVGIVIAAAFCAFQIHNRFTRKRKGYELESIWAMIIRSVVISAAVIWLFWTLSGYRGVPTVLITLMLVLVIYAFITSKTVMGRHVYAIGGNEKAARLSGVKTDRMIFLTYVNMSLLAAIAGIAFAARLNGASPQAGTGFELDAIGSCYIGGASAYGGQGTVSGSLIGALIMGVLNNAMSIEGISQNAQQVVKGLVLLAAVAFDVVSKQRIQIPFISKIFRKRKGTHSLEAA